MGLKIGKLLKGAGEKVVKLAKDNPTVAAAVALAVAKEVAPDLGQKLEAKAPKIVAKVKKYAPIVKALT